MQSGFILQVVVLLAVSRAFGELMHRLGQPQVMGQLLAGIALGPSVLGTVWPAAEQALFPAHGPAHGMIEGIAQLGIVMMLIMTGMQADLSAVRRVRRAALSASVAGIVLPFACGFSLGLVLPQDLLPESGRRLVTALFLGTALSIASVKVVAMVIRQMQFARRTVGQIVLASAIIDDTIGWLIIAMTFGIAARGTLDLHGLGTAALGTAAFLLLSFAIGRPAVSALIRWANDYLHSDFAVVSVILIIGAGMAAITAAIGVQEVLGAIVAGILIGQSPILTRHIDEQLRGLVEGLFMPVFFALSGLAADLRVLRDPRLAMLALTFIVIASAGKFAGAFTGGRLGGMSWRESVALGCAMNARGSTEVIVASIGLSMGALNGQLYAIIVTMALVTTLAMPPSLRWALRRIPLSEEERARIEQEEFEARGFVTTLERLLVVVDQSANGHFASRIAGLLAGSRQILTTVVDVAPGRAGSAFPIPAGEVVRRTASAAAGERGHDGPRTGPAVQSASLPAEGIRHGGVERESRKGHDFLAIGLQRMLNDDGVFADDVVRAVEPFRAAFALVIGRGVHLESPPQSAMQMLVPVSGNEESQRAAEVAFALAYAARAPVTLLYVAPSAQRAAWYRPLPAGALSEQEQAALRSMVALAERFGVEPRTEVARAAVPAEAICARTRQDRCDLLVLGAERRPGETLFFGSTAADVLARADCSVLLVSS